VDGSAFPARLPIRALGRSIDYLARIAAWLSSILAIANNLATDLHLWSSNEFGFVALDDSLCGTSSIFPQKKNPLALEMIKRAAGQAVDWHASTLAINITRYEFSKY
jgi:argininosuccinate lyase